MVEKAPSFDTDAELSLDDEASAYRHFGLEYAPAARVRAAWRSASTHGGEQLLGMRFGDGRGPPAVQDLPG